jgi:16S rRNA processing protein RimM
MTAPEPGLNPETAVTIGRIAGIHGVHGEVRVELLTDFPERFEKGQRVWLAEEPREIERSRWQKNAVIVKLQGIETRTDAERVQGKELMLPEAGELPEDEGVYFQHDIIGLRVEDTKGEEIGAVTDILSTGANDVYVVRGDKGEVLLPAVEDVIKDVDIGAGRIVIDLLPGLEFRQPSWGKKPGGSAKPSRKSVPTRQAGGRIRSQRK